MTMLAALRRHPDFAGFFDLVLPLFWPMLAWQLVRASKQLAAMGRGASLVRVHWWGGITIAWLGDPEPDPSAYRPIPPTRKAWNDLIWSSAVPAAFNIEAGAGFFPCLNGGSGRLQSSLTKGASTLTPHADTS